MMQGGAPLCITCGWVLALLCGVDVVVCLGCKTWDVCLYTSQHLTTQTTSPTHHHPSPSYRCEHLCHLRDVPAHGGLVQGCGAHGVRSTCVYALVHGDGRAHRDGCLCQCLLRRCHLHTNTSIRVQNPSACICAHAMHVQATTRYTSGSEQCSAAVCPQTTSGKHYYGCMLHRAALLKPAWA